MRPILTLKNNTVPLPKTSGIYKLTHKDSGKLYIGSSYNMYNRRMDHVKKLRKDTHHCPPLQNAWNKYGEEAFEWGILEEVPDCDKLIEREQFYFDTLISEKGTGYNVARIAGSNRGNRHTDVTKKLIGDLQRGKPRRPRTEETKAKISAAHTGRKHTPETKAKMSESQKKKAPPTEETKAKIGAAHKGRILPQEHREKISKTLKGHEVSLETREKLRKACSNPSAETIERMRLSHLGNRPSEESKRKSSEGLKAYHANKKAQDVFIGEELPLESNDIRA